MNEDTDATTKAVVAPPTLPKTRKTPKNRSHGRRKFIGIARKKGRKGKPVPPQPPSPNSSSTTTHQNETTTSAPTNNIQVPIPVDNDENNKKRKVRSYDNDEKNRAAVSLLYETTYHQQDTPDSKVTIDEIYDVLGHQIRKDVIGRVVQETKMKIEKNEKYDPRYKSGPRVHKRKIQPGDDEHFIAVFKEKSSYEITTHLFNLLVATPAGRGRIGRTAVFGAIKRMSHTTHRTHVVNQASDKREFWKKARLYYCAQLLIRLGEVLPEEIDINELAHGVVTSSAYNFHELKERGLTIESIYQIAFWDELHIHQEVGESRDLYITFPKDEFGVYDPNGIDTEAGKRRVSDFFYDYFTKPTK